MKNVFDFRDELITDYSSFSRSFTCIAATDIIEKVEAEYKDGRYCGTDPEAETGPIGVSRADRVVFEAIVLHNGVPSIAKTVVFEVIGGGMLAVSARNTTPKAPHSMFSRPRPTSMDVRSFSPVASTKMSSPKTRLRCSAHPST
jgi:hypothetical protein